jgi:hypothetical protein
MDTPPSGNVCAKLEVRFFYSINKQRGVHHEAQKWHYDKTTGDLRGRLNWDKCLDIDDVILSEGTNIQLWDCNNSHAQKFDIVGNTILSRSDNNLAVDAYGVDDRSNIGLWTVHGNANQRWPRRY